MFKGEKIFSSEEFFLVSILPRLIKIKSLLATSMLVSSCQVRRLLRFICSGSCFTTNRNAYFYLASHPMLFNLKLLPLFVPKTNDTVTSGIKTFPRPVFFAVRCYAYVKVCSVKKDIPSIVKYLCFEELQTSRSCWSFLVQFASLKLKSLDKSHLAGVCGTVPEYNVAVPR